VIAALVRGIVLLSLASTIGGLILGLLFPTTAANDLDVARARLRRWVTTCLVILLVATWAELLVRIQAMSDASLGASVAAVPSVVMGTHLGWVLAARAAALVVACFSRLAGLSLLAVAITGSYNTWTQLGGFSRLWSTTYGRVLVAKLSIVAVLVCLGAVARYALLPRLVPSYAARGIGARAFRMARLVVLRRGHGAPSVPVESRLVAYVKIEALVGLAVFACTAVLGEVTPGRHVTFERKTTTHVPPATRPGAGGSRAGTVTPPRGDAERGRAVFARLECATCHAVPDQSFAPPTRPGPDLAGIGARHPGEIVESIMNPNAQILDGPGYTDERGLSTMPDYRDRLTVGELSDLVEYLRSFERPAAPAPEPAPTKEQAPAKEQPPASGEPSATERQP